MPRTLLMLCVLISTVACGLDTADAAPTQAELFAASENHYSARGAVLSLRQDAANGTGAPQLGLAADYPPSLPAWREAQRRFPDNTAPFDPCANALIAATDEIKRIAPLMARGSNLAALNAGIKRAKALVSEGDTCIAKADKEGQTRLQGQATEQIPSTGPGSNNRLRGGVNGGGIVPPGGGTTNTIPPGGGQDTFGGGTTNTIPPGGGQDTFGGGTTGTGRGDPCRIPVRSVVSPKGYRVPEGFRQPAPPNYVCYDKKGFPYTVDVCPEALGDYLDQKPRVPPLRVGYDECINPRPPKGCPPMGARDKYERVVATDTCYPPLAERGKPKQDEPIPVFHFYYVNGINTPEHDDTPTGRSLDEQSRGSYDWDRQMVANYILGTDSRLLVMNRNSPKREAVVAETRVAANERVVFEDRTYNQSGANPYSIGQCIAGQNSLQSKACAALNELNKRRKDNVAHMAGGDILECALQSITENAELAAHQKEVKEWVERILNIYRTEARSARPRVKHYFILIGHSQGNFLVEGMANRLRLHTGTQARFVYDHRLAIVALASPTNYASLGDGSSGLADFHNRRLRHLTRADDGILALRTLGIPFTKTPFEATLPALWDYRKEALPYLLRLTLPDLINTRLDNFGPAAAAFGWMPPGTCVPEGKVGCNLALYTPLMNAHLSDNYLAEPPMTQPTRRVNDRIIPFLDMSKMDLPRTSVAGHVRAAVRALKSDLLVNN